MIYFKTPLHFWNRYVFNDTFRKHANDCGAHEYLHVKNSTKKKCLLYIHILRVGHNGHSFYFAARRSLSFLLPLYIFRGLRRDTLPGFASVQRARQLLHWHSTGLRKFTDGSLSSADPKELTAL